MAPNPLKVVIIYKSWQLLLIKKILLNKVYQVRWTRVHLTWTKKEKSYSIVDICCVDRVRSWKYYTLRWWYFHHIIEGRFSSIIIIIIISIDSGWIWAKNLKIRLIMKNFWNNCSYLFRTNLWNYRGLRQTLKNWLDQINSIFQCQVLKNLLINWVISSSNASKWQLDNEIL